MPFKKMSNGKFKSPSGRVMTGAQVRAYYAKTKGKGRGRKKKK